MTVFLQPISTFFFHTDIFISVSVLGVFFFSLSRSAYAYFSMCDNIFNNQHQSYTSYMKDREKKLLICLCQLLMFTRAIFLFWYFYFSSIFMMPERFFFRSHCYWISSELMTQYTLCVRIFNTFHKWKQKTVLPTPVYTQTHWQQWD